MLRADVLTEELYSPFSPYNLSFPHSLSTHSVFDAEMKRGAPDSDLSYDNAKKPRQYAPNAMDSNQHAALLNAQFSSPATLYGAPALGASNSAVNGLNGPLDSVQAYGNGANVGMASAHLNHAAGLPNPMMFQTAPGGMHSQGVSNPQQQQMQYFQQQMMANQGAQNPSPSNNVAQQQQMNLAAMQGMQGMPGMFGNMPMNMQFGFPQMGMGFNQAPGHANPVPDAVAAAAAAAQGNATGRTVYIGNLPADASVDELLNLVHFGPIESVRVLPERSCVFISFLDGPTAASFHADATMKKLSLHGQELKIGWGKPSPVPSQVLLSIQQSNASRNVYLGGLDERMTEEMLRDDLSRFGLIDQVKIVRDKGIGFVHFLSISTATKVVATLPTEPAWAGKRVNYGKDRCAYVPKSQQQQSQTAHAAHAQAVVQASGLSPYGTTNFSSPFASNFDTAGMMAAVAAQGQQMHMNRTVYLGNIHPDTTIEDMCNTIRGGALQTLRYLADKHIAFVTFVDPTAAYTFWMHATHNGIMLNNRRLKVGWGKHSGPISPSLALSIHAGATRNVYVGNIEDFEKFTVEKLRADFEEYGEVELVNFLKEKNCGFVNFTNITNAIKAIDGIKAKPEYTNLRIAHGKDRCANPPRVGGGPGPQQQMRKPSHNNRSQNDKQSDSRSPAPERRASNDGETSAAPAPAS